MPYPRGRGKRTLKTPGFGPMGKGHGGVVELSKRKESAVRRVDGMTRDEVCRALQSKVRLIARRLHDRLSSDVRIPVDDLAAAGVIGLLEAFDRYDAARGTAFSTYAEYRIRGAMYDSLRDNDAFSRRRRQLAKRIQAAGDEIRRDEGRAPEAPEIASRLGLGLDAYHEAVSKTKPVVHVPFDAPEDDSAGAVGERLSDGDPDVEARLVDRDVRLVLQRAIEELPDRHRECVLMYYTKDVTLAEIAAVFGVTVSRVSQILSDARSRLKRTLATTLDPDDLKIMLGT